MMSNWPRLTNSHCNIFPSLLATLEPTDRVFWISLTTCCKNDSVKEENRKREKNLENNSPIPKCNLISKPAKSASPQSRSEPFPNQTSPSLPLLMVIQPATRLTLSIPPKKNPKTENRKPRASSHPKIRSSTPRMGAVRRGKATAGEVTMWVRNKEIFGLVRRWSAS